MTFKKKKHILFSINIEVKVLRFYFKYLNNIGGKHQPLWIGDCIVIERDYLNRITLKDVN